MRLQEVASRAHVRRSHIFAFGQTVLIAFGGLSVAANAEAQLSVGDSGTASYSQPLEVPPGVAGMSPKLGVLYTGGGVNGPLGTGWSIQGLSTITRCPPTVAIDGKRSGVVYGPSDKLCLDGQRLIQTNANGTPLAFPQSNDAAGLASGAYSEFRTEKDIYARVRAYGRANNDASGASGPAYFRVWTKAGQIYDYGATLTADSHTKALITPAGSTVPIAWAVARISDTTGNVIDFKYEQRDVAWGSGPTAGSPTIGHEWNLLEVQYSGNKVIFNYDVDAQGNDLRPDKSEAYNKGVKNLSLRRLKSITTYVNEAANMGTLGAGPGVAAKTVKLTYDIGPNSGRSRISKTQVCAGGPSSTRCLPAIVLTYAPGGQDTYEANSTFTSSQFATLNMQGPTSGIYLGDFDGNGRTDILYWSDNPSANRLYLSKGDGDFEAVPAGSGSGHFNITDYLAKSDGCYMSIASDFNADGVTDILRVMQATAGTTSCGTPVNLLFLAKGDGGFDQVTLPATIDLTQIGQVRTLRFNCENPPSEDYLPNCVTRGTTYLGMVGDQGSNFHLIDVNGDGYLDIVTSIFPAFGQTHSPPLSDPLCVSVVCTHVWLAGPGGTFSELTTTNLAHHSVYADPRASFGSTVRRPYVLDANGDGLADLMPGGGLWISRGDGDFDTGTYNAAVLGCTSPLDFNGDGRQDCLIAASPSSLTIGDGTLNGTQAANFLISGPGGSAIYGEDGSTLRQNIGIVPADMDGDGREDLIRWGDDTAKNAVLRSNGDGTFTQAAVFSIDGVSTTQLQKSDGTAVMLPGDFTGHGTTEILRLQNVDGTVTNRLFTKSDTTPPDQLFSVKNGSGQTTKLYYIPLSNPIPINDVSASLGARYNSDRGNTSAALPRTVDLSVPMYVVATSVSDSGFGATTVNTEFSYAGLKADLDGRGILGFREVMRESPAPDGSPLTSDTQYLLTHPYTGAASTASTYHASLDSISGVQALSNTANVYCDQTVPGAETSATASTPCPVTNKVARPYLYKSTESGQDLNGAALPQLVTTSAYNGTGDPTNIVVTTTATTAGASRTFIRTTSNSYFADNTACSDELTCDWILGRLKEASVANQVPNLLSELALSAGTGAHASATAGSGPLLAAFLKPLSFGFGSRTVGDGANTDFELANDGASALTITVPSSASVSGSDFSFVSTTCASSLPAASKCIISVRFAPTAASSRSGTLSITTGAGAFSSQLTGKGVAPSLSRTAGWTNWGTVGAGSDSGDTFKLTNNSTVPLLIVSHSASGPTGFWASQGDASSCQPGVTVLSPAHFCTSFVGTGGLATPGAHTGTDTVTFQAQGVTASTYSVQQVYTYAIAETSDSPTTLNFGSVTQNTTSASQTVTLTNSAGEPFENLSVVKSGAASASFSLTNHCGSVVAANASCTLTVTFKPTANGAHSAILTVTGAYARRTSGSGPFNYYAHPQTLTAVSLTGTGQGSVATRTSAATLTASSAWYGHSAKTVTATYRNDGNVPMTLTSAGLSAPLSISSNGCSNVAVGASCSIVVSVGTNVAGLNQSQTFAPVGATVAPASTTIGWSTKSAVPRWSPTSLNFSNVIVNTTSQKNLTLYNDGNTVYDWATNNGIVNAPSGYSFNTAGCSSVAASGGSCTVVVTFAPTTIAAAYSGSGVSMEHESYHTNTFAVSGTGAGSIATLTGAAPNLGTAWWGATAPSSTATFKNTGNAAMTLTGLSGMSSRFHLNVNSCSGIAPQASCSMTIGMPTSATGSGPDSVSTAGATTNASFAINGAVYSAVSSWSTTSLAFGNVAAGSSKTLTLSLTNNGTGSDIDWSGPLAILPAGFTANTSACSSLGPAGTCSVSIKFAPVSGVSYSGSNIRPAGNVSYTANTLSVSGAGTSLISGSPTSVSFGTLTKGTYVVRTLTIHNESTAQATGLAYELSYTGGLATYGTFHLPGGGTCPASGGNLAANASCTVLVEFDSACSPASGTRHGTLTTSGSNFTSLTTDLSGTTGTGACN